ncbi:MAG: aminotransferase class I/II-fold pyridoxal phosphate-dependent enzyme [Bacteriovoracaceae bacterium]|nr:aminotransferase class I/II-fold pyridoxal phosphate-dependent enzyme [Bacteriovoracaceae bacterium]
MLLSSRVKGVSDSITQQLNEKAQNLAEEGQIIYNLSAGQLPIKPPQEFIEKIQQQLNFLKSYQYSPVTGIPELKKKILSQHFEKRKIEGEGLDVIVSNGSKQSIYIALGAILDPGDEVILLAPYWVSYPEMIKFWGGIPVPVKSNVYDAFSPVLEDIAKVITPRTKAIIINSPNNPAGIHYPEKWMKAFAALMKEHSEVWLLSDEVYSDLSYFDPEPTYFYQHEPSLIERTMSFGAISKSLAATGLRLGWTIAPKSAVSAMGKIQGQTTSGASALIQRALVDFDFSQLGRFLEPVKVHLRRSANMIREKLRASDLPNLWYQSHSAFYFMLDFSRTPMFARFAGEHPENDYSKEICQEILETLGIALVPGTDFGLPNSARMSLTMEEVPFQEAINKLVTYLITP